MARLAVAVIFSQSPFQCSVKANLQAKTRWVVVMRDLWLWILIELLPPMDTYGELGGSLFLLPTLVDISCVMLYVFGHVNIQIFSSNLADRWALQSNLKLFVYKWVCLKIVYP